jgi:fibronectin type 3 domain-containing protein
VHRNIEHQLEFHQDMVDSKEDPHSLNHKNQHLSKKLLTFIDQTHSIMIDPSATESFISGTALKRIKVKEIEHDEFIFLEMASRANQKVGRNVTCYTLNLGDFFTRSNLYVTILGS